MAGDGWKHIDLELPPICKLCGKRVLRRETFEYRYNLELERGEVRHIACIRSIEKSVATDA